MLERFKQFEIKKQKVIYGGVHTANDGVLADNMSLINFTNGIARDHGNNDGIPPDGAFR